MTTTLQPASTGLRLGEVFIDLLAMAAGAGIGWLLTESPGVAGVIAAEVGIALLLARAATGRTPGALLTRTVAHAEGTDRAPGLRIRGVKVVDLRPVEVQETHVDAYGRETVALGAGPGAPPPKAPSKSMQPVPIQTQAKAAPARNQLQAGAPLLVPGSSEPDASLSPTSSAPGAAVDVPGSIWLVADSGERCEVRGTVVLGRAPEAAGFGDEVAFEVNDPARSLSRNHARVGRGEEGLWVEDAHSSNGTAIRTPLGDVIPVHPGSRVRLEIGCELLMGDRTVRVLTA